MYAPAGWSQIGKGCRDRGFFRSEHAGVSLLPFRAQSPLSWLSLSICAPYIQYQNLPLLKQAKKRRKKHSNFTWEYSHIQACSKHIAVLGLRTFVPICGFNHLTLFRWYRSSIFRSTCGILRVHPWSSQNLAIWSRKLSLTLVCAWKREISGGAKEKDESFFFFLKKEKMQAKEKTPQMSLQLNAEW